MALRHEQLTEQIIGAAIEVHRALGPGLLENAHEECLYREFSLRDLAFRRQVDLPVSYKGVRLDCGYRIDVVVEEKVVVELESTEGISEVHSAQILTYLRLGDYPVGLLFNFNAPTVKEGMRRLVL